MITVVGSYNVDLEVKVDRFPSPSETVFSRELLILHGGKGSNQAVSASRLKGNVQLVAAVGDDEYGTRAIRFLREENVGTRYVTTKRARTGTAIVMVDSEGENMIVVDRGANMLLEPSDLGDSMNHTDVLLTQLEVKDEVVSTALNQCVDCIRILNPAPAVLRDFQLLRHVDVLTPNEVEAKQLAHASTVVDAANSLLKLVRYAVVVTLGDQGALVVTRRGSHRVPTLKVRAKDTTGAGDVFNSALAVMLDGGRDLEDAVKFANMAAAISTLTEGALGPRFEEIEEHVRS